MFKVISPQFTLPKQPRKTYQHTIKASSVHQNINKSLKKLESELSSTKSLLFDKVVELQNSNAIHDAEQQLVSYTCEKEMKSIIQDLNEENRKLYQKFKSHHLMEKRINLENKKAIIEIEQQVSDLEMKVYDINRLYTKCEFELKNEKIKNRKLIRKLHLQNEKMHDNAKN